MVALEAAQLLTGKQKVLVCVTVGTAGQPATVEHQREGLSNEIERHAACIAANIGSAGVASDAVPE